MCELSGVSVSMLLQSPFSGEDEDELFDSICNHQVTFSRYLDQTTINFLDKVLNFSVNLHVLFGCYKPVTYIPATSQAIHTHCAHTPTIFVGCY